MLAQPKCFLTGKDSHPDEKSTIGMTRIKKYSLINLLSQQTKKVCLTHSSFAADIMSKAQAIMEIKYHAVRYPTKPNEQ